MIFKVDIKRIISILLVSLFMVSIPGVSVSAALADLAHDEEVEIKVLKENEDAESAAAPCVNDKAVIKKENGKTMLYMTLTDNGSSSLTGYLNDLYYYKNSDDYNNDVKSDVNVIKTNDLGYPEEISIELTSDDNTIYIGFKIAIPSMPTFDMEHKARIIYNTEDSEEDEVDQEEDKNEGGSENNILDLKDGTYNVPVSFIKIDSEELSKANSCLNENAKLVVENGIGKIYLELKDMEFAGAKAGINNLWFYKSDVDYSNGNKTLAEVVSTNENNRPEVVAFTLPSKSDEIKLAAEISLGHNSLSNFRLKIDYDKVSEQKYEDGLYEVEINLLNAGKDEESMASSAIDKKALVNIVDGKAEIYLSTKPLTIGTIIASLQTLQYEEIDGTYSYADVTTKSQDGTPTGFKFTLPSYDEILNVKVNPMVAIMGNRDINARLKVDYSTMVLSNDASLPSDNEDKKEESDSNKSQLSNNIVNENGENTSVAIATSTETRDNTNVIPLVTILMVSLATILATKNSIKRRV